MRCSNSSPCRAELARLVKIGESKHAYFLSSGDIYVDNSTNRPSRFISPREIAKSNGYTHVVDTSGQRTIYISGQVPLDVAGNLVGHGDLRAQTVQIFENLKYALASVGADFNHVVKLTYFYLDITQIQIVRDVRDQYVNTAQPPASSAVEVTRLFREGILLEVEAIAVIP
jgi:enamine deaminase RidA (YjgF/YER057c/UK114 family)